MAEITAANVGKLREMTGAGLMDCKKALTENQGDLDLAVDWLRKKGVASAAKKADRAANEGVIAQHIAPGSKVGVLLEVNCETDFVAKNEQFRAFCDELAKKIAGNPGVDLEADRVAAVAKIGENIRLNRHTRWEVSGSGLIAAYIHTGAKVGVLVEVGAGKDETVSSEAFKELVRDITLQIAAGNPTAVSREQIPVETLDKEDEIARNSDALKGKPAAAMANILKGKREKYFQTVCLVEQGFVKKNGEITVKEHIATVGKALGDEVVVRRFLRYQIGVA
ncbi:MAG: translation elongation factor Ts [Proteobacteria bacterium]|nr:translation elongation factor Ts [Pseudomonadota bacterium]